MVDEERRFAVKGWLPTLVRSLVQVACSEPSESDRPSLSYLLRLIAQNEISNDIKSNFGEDVLDSLTSYINNLKDRYADLSPEGDGRVNELLYCDASEKLKPPKKRRRRFFYKKRSSRGRKWIESDDDTVSEDSDGRVPPIWGTDSRRAVPQARNLLFSDSDGLSAVYAEIHSLTYADMTFSGAHTISKLKRMFPGFNDEALFSSDAAQFRLSIVVMARFLTDSTRRHFLGLLETYFGSLETFLPQTLTFAIDVLNWLLVTTVTDHFEDAHFVEFVLKLIVSILQKCYEISPSDEKSADGVEHLYRAVDTSLQAFFYSSYRGFALNGELLTSGFEYLVNFQTNKVIQTVANLIPLVHHNSLNEKCCCKHFFTLVKRSSALADNDNECKSRLTSLLLHNVHMNILCSCIETLEIIEFLCALIEPSKISEGLGQLCTHFLRSRRGSELNELKEHGLSIFDQLISRFESDYNLTDITFLNDILSALSSLDDVSYLVETCVLQNLIRISGQGSEQTLAGGHERFVELIKVLVSFMDTSICCLAVNDVILANVPTFLALTVESDVFPKTVSMLIKKATADRSEELLQAMCKQLDESMRVASSDIWVLVSASAMSFFKKLVALLELFNLVQEELPPDVASKLVSDSQRLVNLCCEYFAHPLKDFRSNYRLTQLLALTLRFSSDPEVLSGITEAIRESSECAFSFVASTLPSALLDSALGIGANSVIQSTPSEVVERESEYDESVAASSPGTEFTFAVKSDDTYFLLVSIDCIHAMTEKYEKFNEHLEFALKTFAERMRPLRFEDLRRLSKCIDKLLDLCDLCVAKNASSSTFDSLVACVMYLISQEPSTEHIYRVFRSFDSYHPFQTSVVKALNRIFDSQPFQDCTMLRFPVQNSPSFESQSIQEHVAKESDPISSKKVTTIQRSLTVIGALERFFTGSNSTKRASESDLKSLATNSAGVFSEENFFVPSAAALLSFDTANLTALSEGLSAAFWIRLRETELEDLFHVLSVGDSAVHASLLVSPCEKRIVITISNGGVVVARKSVKRQVSTSRWTHTVLTFRVVDNHASASLLIGDSLHEICYDIVPECTEDGHGSALIYGSVTFGAISQVICSWQYEISSIFGFKGVLSPTAALVLRAFGFQTNSITRCLSDSQQIPRLSSVFTKAVLSSKRFHLGALLNDCDKFVQLLQRGLLFVFRCDTPEVYGLSGLQPGVNSHLFGDVRKDGDSSLFSLIAFREFPISWRTSQYSLAVDRSLDDIVYTFGSIKLFLFCYAQSVDLIMDDEAQLAVLRVVFKSLQRDPRDYTRFKQMKGENILIAILSNSFAALNWDIFYEIVRSLVSDLSLSGDGTITVAWTSTILDPEFLIKFAFYSKIWKKNRIVYWVELLRIIAACAREDVKFHEFNILQLKRVNFLQSMLHSSSDFCVWNNIEQLIDSLKVLIRTFVDSPGTADTVIALWNFILLSHTAANTYVLSNIEGYNNWLQIGSMRCPESEPVIPGETPLSSLLSNIYETLGKNRVSEIWKKTASVTAIRKVFRECLQVQNGIDRGWTDSSVSLESTLASTHNISKETITGDDGNLEAGEESEETNEGSSQTFLDELQLMTSGTGWIADLRAAIFEILCSLLVTASDDLMKVLFSNAAFHWDSALVLLTSQTDARIRDCVFMFLHKFFLRCSPSIRLSFIASDGFVLLGNQMRNHQVTEIITDALFGILCNSAVKLSDGLDETHLASLSIDRFTCASLHALFVLFEESVSDSALFWNVGGALQKIFESNSILMQAMMDAGLIEIMSSALYRITKLPEETCDLFGVHYLSNRGEMWHSFACRIVSRCVPFDELSMYNKCEEFLWLCLMADWQSSLDGRNSDFVREQLSGLVLHWINTISSSVQKEGRSASTVPSLEDVHTGISSNDTDSFVDDYEILSMESISAGNQFSDLSNANDPSPAFPFSQSFNDLKDRFLGTQNVSRLLKVKYKWQNKSVLANPTDLSHRVSFALEMASHLLVSLALPQNASEVEMELFQLVLTIFCSSWTESCTQKRSSRRVGSDCPTITWSGLLSVSRDRVHVLFAQLIAFALYPAQLKCRVLNGQMCSDSESQYVAHRQFGIVASLCYEVNCKQMLRTLLDINLDGQYAMNVALHEMALFPSESDDRRDRCIDQLVTFLRNVQIESPFANLSFDGINSLIQDEIISLHSYSSHRKTFFDRMRSKATEIVDRESKATDRISMDAMGVTCKVTESQNVFRKAFMRQLRSMETTHYEAEKMLMALTAELSHLEGCGLRKKAWFESWSLDSSEGPHRERRKLVPTHAMYSERFVLEEFRDRLQARLEKPPLSSLFHGEAADLASRLHRVEISEGIRYSVGATVVRSTFECFGEVLVGDAKLYFFGETAKSTQKGTQCSTITFSWNYTDVTEVFKRDYLLEDTALEIFLSSGDAYLIVFSSLEVDFCVRIPVVSSLGEGNFLGSHFPDALASVDKRCFLGHRGGDPPELDPKVEVRHSDQL
ncbi:hypothetical protein L596_015054 [Steinernema carpocapsae]|uniref:BEACH-type PH domain-containing protein n=1 Tax=Steinernema carpocapsae TaxID=34508 RepID=A0A4U5NF29_STECR|nr:hypothetical protein L596_015054 [Steinernema carpocapsae]